MAEILTSIGGFIEAAFAADGWIAGVADVIVSTPVLLIFVVCVPLVGLGVGLFKRLINAN